MSSRDVPLQTVFGAALLQPIDSNLSLSFRGQYDFNDHIGVSLNAQNVNFGDGEVTNFNHVNEARYWLSLRVAR